MQALDFFSGDQSPTATTPTAPAVGPQNLVSFADLRLLILSVETTVTLVSE